MSLNKIGKTISYLWFNGLQGWQITSFNPESDEAIGFHRERHPTDTLWTNIEYSEYLETENAKLKAKLAKAIEQRNKAINITFVNFKDECVLLIDKANKELDEI
jgi:hypothetical protein